MVRFDKLLLQLPQSPRDSIPLPAYGAIPEAYVGDGGDWRLPSLRPSNFRRLPLPVPPSVHQHNIPPPHRRTMEHLSLCRKRPSHENQSKRSGSRSEKLGVSHKLCKKSQRTRMTNQTKNEKIRKERHRASSAKRGDQSHKKQTSRKQETQKTRNQTNSRSVHRKTKAHNPPEIAPIAPFVAAHPSPPLLRQLSSDDGSPKAPSTAVSCMADDPPTTCESRGGSPLLRALLRRAAPASTTSSASASAPASGVISNPSREDARWAHRTTTSTNQPTAQQPASSASTTSSAAADERDVEMDKWIKDLYKNARAPEDLRVLTKGKQARKEIAKAFGTSRQTYLQTRKDMMDGGRPPNQLDKQFMEDTKRKFNAYAQTWSTDKGRCYCSVECKQIQHVRRHCTKHLAPDTELTAAWKHKSREAFLLDRLKTNTHHPVQSDKAGRFRILKFEVDGGPGDFFIGQSPKESAASTFIPGQAEAGQLAASTSQEQQDETAKQRTAQALEEVGTP